jgi:large subunit ribosomal protein L32
MPVPKRKRSKRRRDQRFANKGMKVKAIAKCAQCAAPIATHVACKECGYYKGVKVLSTKNDRTLKRKETLAARQPAQSASQEPTE